MPEFATMAKVMFRESIRRCMHSMSPAILILVIIPVHEHAHSFVHFFTRGLFDRLAFAVIACETSENESLRMAPTLHSFSFYFLHFRKMFGMHK